MYAAPPKKLMILNILDILKKYSDQDHRLSVKDIVCILDREYSQKADRKAVRRNLAGLIDFGYDIACTKTVRRNKFGEEEDVYSDWYLNHAFIDAELRLLIDSLLFSRHIPNSQRKELIKKLEGLSSIYFKAKVKHIRSIPEKHPQSKPLFYTIEVLDEAITRGRRVQFQYISNYGTDKKPLIHKDSDGNPTVYEVSPYQMAAANGRYYLICAHKRHPNISNYRIDRIMDISIIEDEPITPIRDICELKNGLDLSRYMAENIYMFSGESIHARLRAKKYIIKDILDWFGDDVRLTDEGGDCVTVDVRVNQQAMFYWSMQYGEHIEVLAPGELRADIMKAAGAMCRKYKDEESL